MNRYLVGFGAGFFAVLLFHQPALAILTAAGMAKAAADSGLMIVARRCHPR